MDDVSRWTGARSSSLGNNFWTNLQSNQVKRSRR